MSAAAEILPHMQELYDRAQYPAAYEAGKPLGPLKSWPGTTARLLAARLAMQLGAPRLARALIFTTWRQAPQDPEACFFYAHDLTQRGGPWRGWRFLQEVGEMPAAPRVLRAQWFGLHAICLAVLRDFGRAEQWMERAEELASDDPFVWVQRSVVLGCEDRCEEALAAALGARELRPWYRPAVEATVEQLLQLDRQQEALELLDQANQRLTSGLLVWRQAGLLADMERFEETWSLCAKIAELLPLMEKRAVQELAGLRAHTAYCCGKLEEALRFSREAESPFFEQMAQRLESGQVGCRKLLPVPFVRQHHKTCAPATVVSLSRYWDKPADQLQVAREICYGGTPAHEQRSWAERNGFRVREFRVTWESAVALIDRQVPFAMQLSTADWAHLLAVIGYDSRLRTLLVRDPARPGLGEFGADKLLEESRATGPRGTAMVPREKGALLDGLELPEEEIYEQLDRVACCLRSHQGEEARQVVEKLERDHPGHRLCIEARARLASYDGDPATGLKCTERLLEQFPDAAMFRMLMLSFLTELARREQRLELLREACHGPHTAVVYWQRYAAELSDDARQHPQAAYWLRRAIRADPTAGENYRLLGNIQWTRQRREEALGLYRFGACLEETDEQCAHTYFVASHHLRRTEEALGLLRDRFERYGGQSGWPARTLGWALLHLDRFEEMFALLQAALRLRPDDGDLLLFAAEMHASCAQEARAGELLEAARSVAHPHQWLRTAAELARRRGELETARRYWCQLVEAEPLALDAQRTLARLLFETQGTDAAAEHLQGVVGRFPHSYGLRVALIEYLREADPAAWESAIRQLLEIHPADAWTHRELACALAASGRFDEALASAEEARRLDPSAPNGYVIAGHIFHDLDRQDEARQSYRRAIRLSVDEEAAIAGLIAACRTRQQREDELMFVYEELVRQVIFGDGLLSFREYAAGTLEPETLLEVFREALDVRPDLWHAHCALIRQLTAMGRTDEALARAARAAEQFPLLPRIWLELAAVRWARGELAEEIEVLIRAVELNPSWDASVRALADAHQRAGDPEKARKALQRALASEPANPILHRSLAGVLRKLGDLEGALDHWAKAVRIEPSFLDAWSELQHWASESSRPELPRQLARQLVGDRPYDRWCWFLLADVLDAPDERGESTDALQRVLELDPRMIPAHQLRIRRLLEDGQPDEARAACHPAVFGDAPPPILRLEAARVEGRCGRLQQAIEQCRAIVDDDPAFLPAWNYLAECSADTGQDQQFLEAAEQVVRLEPDDPVSWGCLGAARIQTGNRQRAKEALARAIEMAPGYEFAAVELFGMQLEDGQTQQALRTLEATAAHLRPPLVCELRARSAAATNDAQGAEEALRELCRDPGEEGANLLGAVSALAKAEMAETIDAVLRPELDRPDTLRAVGNGWAAARIGVNLVADCISWLEHNGEAGACWWGVAEEVLCELAERSDRAEVVRMLKRHGERLRAHNATWSAMGHALTQIGDPPKAVRWMGDWNSRQELAPRHLFPLAGALWELDRLDEAMQVSRHGVNLPPDPAARYFRLGLAALALVQGDVESAGASLRAANPRSFGAEGFYGALADLIQAAVAELERQPRPSSREIRRALRRAWRGHKSLFLKNRILRRLYRRVLVRHAGDTLTRLWAAGDWLAGLWD